MVDKICNFLTDKIRNEMPEVDDQKAEELNYGIQLIVGEVPKIFIMIAIACILGIGRLSILSFLIILPYRSFSGGFHLKTHLGCIICTTSMYCGNVLLSKYLTLEPIYIKYIAILCVWIFGMIMVSLYAPADTENVPILSKKERKKQKIMSYITLSITLLIAIFIKDNLISSMIIYGMLIQSIAITKLAYKITNNKYSYEVYSN